MEPLEVRFDLSCEHQGAGDATGEVDWDIGVAPPTRRRRGGGGRRRPAATAQAEPAQEPEAQAPGPVDELGHLCSATDSEEGSAASAEDATFPDESATASSMGAAASGGASSDEAAAAVSRETAIDCVPLGSSMDALRVAFPAFGFDERWQFVEEQGAGLPVLQVGRVKFVFGDILKCTCHRHERCQLFLPTPW